MIIATHACPSHSRPEAQRELLRCPKLQPHRRRRRPRPWRRPCKPERKRHQTPFRAYARGGEGQRKEENARGNAHVDPSD
eukprot:2050506-Lingulodinium_polyedra.AAC.1